MDKKRDAGNDDVAVIGLACRFPDADNPVGFWENLESGKSSIHEIPANRWDWKAYWGDPQNEENKTNSKWGSFILDVVRIPGHSGHTFRTISATGSNRFRPPIPEDSGHFNRTFSDNSDVGSLTFNRYEHLRLYQLDKGGVHARGESNHA